MLGKAVCAQLISFASNSNPHQSPMPMPHCKHEVLRVTAIKVPARIRTESCRILTLYLQESCRILTRISPDDTHLNTYDAQ